MSVRFIDGTTRWGNRDGRNLKRARMELASTRLLGLSYDCVCFRHNQAYIRYSTEEVCDFDETQRTARISYIIEKCETGLLQNNIWLM